MMGFKFLGAVASATMLITAASAAPTSPGPCHESPRDARPCECLMLERADGASPVTEVSLGEARAWLVVDTGSSGTTLDAETVAALALARDGASETAQGLGGPTDVRLFRLPRLEAGPLSRTDLTVVEVPAPGFESHRVVGLAGVDLFGTALTIWSQMRCISLRPSGEAPEGAGWREIDARWLRPWKIMLPIRIGGVSGWGLLDTGAQFTVLNRAFAERLGLTVQSGRLRPSEGISGLDGTPLALAAADVSGVEIGDWRWSERSVRVGDLPVFGRLGETGELLAIVGADWLADRSFAIDYGRETVWLKTP